MPTSRQGGRASAGAVAVVIALVHERLELPALVYRASARGRPVRARRRVRRVVACRADPCAPALDPNSAAEVQAILGMPPGGPLDLGNICEGYPSDNDFPAYYAAAGDPTGEPFGTVVM
jgi:hypothetical protein